MDTARLEVIRAQDKNSSGCVQKVDWSGFKRERKEQNLRAFERILREFEKLRE
jgi:hypothetical protein